MRGWGLLRSSNNKTELREFIGLSLQYQLGLRKSVPVCDRGQTVSWIVSILPNRVASHTWCQDRQRVGRREELISETNMAEADPSITYLSRQRNEATNKMSIWKKSLNHHFPTWHLFSPSVPCEHVMGLFSVCGAVWDAIGWLKESWVRVPLYFYIRIAY